MLGEKQLLQWWDQRPEDQRVELKRAAEKSVLDPAAVRLLLATNCPVGPVGTKWEAQPEFAWHWPEHVRAFVIKS